MTKRRMHITARLLALGTAHAALYLAKPVDASLGSLGLLTLVVTVTTVLIYLTTALVYTLKNWTRPDVMDPTERIQTKLAWWIHPASKDAVWDYLLSIQMDDSTDSLTPEDIVETLQTEFNVTGETVRHKLAWAIHPQSPTDLTHGFEYLSDSSQTQRVVATLRNNLVLHDSYGNRI